MSKATISQKFNGNPSQMNEPKVKKKKNCCSTHVHLLREFCGYTSWGGLGRVVGTKFLIFKALWLLIFVAALGMATFQLIPLFYKYRDRPINTRISLHHNATINFPSVVFCNFNMIRKSKIGELPEFAINALTAYVSEETLRGIPEPNDDKDEDEDEYDDDDEYDDEEESDEIDPELLDKVYKAEEKLSIMMADVSQETLKEIGHQFDDMIVSCTFKGVNCRNFTKFWSQFWHYKYGNCFVFNPYVIKGNKSTKQPLRASKPGPLYGLTVSLDIQQDEYVDQLTQTAGAAVLISERGKMPFPYEEGISVAPGFSTSLGLRMLNIHREDRFNNNSCIKDDVVSDLNIFAKKYNMTYSRTACEQSCIARTQMEVCNCLEYKYPGEEGYNFCDVVNKTVVSCLRKVARKAKNGQLNCSGCRPLCSEKMFQVTSSFSKWPSVKYEKFLTQSLNKDDDDDDDDGDNDDNGDNGDNGDDGDDQAMDDEEKNATGAVDARQMIGNNYLKVQIYFQELNFEVIEESISYQVENFLSDIGGQLGLWLGASCLSGIEVAELLAFMLVHLLGRKKTPKDDEENIPLEEGLLDNKTTNGNKPLE